METTKFTSGQLQRLRKLEKQEADYWWAWRFLTNKNYSFSSMHMLPTTQGQPDKLNKTEVVEITKEKYPEIFNKLQDAVIEMFYNHITQVRAESTELKLRQLLDKLAPKWCRLKDTLINLNTVTSVGVHEDVNQISFHLIEEQPLIIKCDDKADFDMQVNDFRQQLKDLNLLIELN